MTFNERLVQRGICPRCFSNIRLNFTKNWTECECDHPVKFHGEWPDTYSEYQELQIINHALGTGIQKGTIRSKAFVVVPIENQR